MKARFQYRDTGINLFVLARGGKKRLHEALERFLLVFFLISIASVLLETIAGDLIPMFFRFAVLEWTGVFVTAAGIALFFAAMFTMRNSWRIGIDAGKKTRIVKSGVYAFSRNPAFTGTGLMFAGLFLSYPDFLSLFLSLFEMTVMHLHILNEEKNLSKTMGKEYLAYKKRERRDTFCSEKEKGASRALFI